MLTRFDTRSPRVKGLSFHPQRPWILASLHSGVIQLWDYQMGTLLDTFEEHVGPVRGIDFHRLQPIFVSGGDDYKIKLWNYKSRRCLFTLTGHLDYIRTVEFHREHPWFVSASDDQTIRIWNWQSRSCVSVLTGHNHYVMCASFHPRNDLIVSASLDHTVRVWDTSGLRKKTVRGSGPADMMSGPRSSSADFFGADATVKYVLEGHDRGVNWASFHPTDSYIVSGADDRVVKIWRMNDAKAWEVNTLRGHSQNVSCVMYHPVHDLILSNSEDRSIRIWDSNRHITVQCFRREHDRFWILAVHPTQNLLAAGHDSGMVVFKLERERPPYDCASGSILFYVKNQELRRAVLGAAQDVPIHTMQRGTAISFTTRPRTLVVNQFNSSEENVLVHSLQDGGTYELYCLNETDITPKVGLGVSATFLSRNRFVVLDRTQHLAIKDFSNETKKRLRSPYQKPDFLFPCSVSGRILVRSDDSLCLFETQSRRMLHELTGVHVRYVVWSKDGEYVALLSRNTLVIANRDLNSICTIHEAVRLKSAVWDNDHNVLIYCTLTHIKYALPIARRETGILRTLDVPVYMVEAKENEVHCLDRTRTLRSIRYDPTEYLFKWALEKREYVRVVGLIRTGNMCGQAVIAYLQRAGYPEVALHFVDDPSTRFNLALECGNLDVARECAAALGKPESWNQLAVEALRQGHVAIAETAYQQMHNFDRLSFLYLITGQREKLNKMLLIAQKRGDVMSRFHNALYLGDAAERVRVLEAAGQVALAFVTAQSFGLDEDADRLRGYLEEAELPVPDASRLGVAAERRAALRKRATPSNGVAEGEDDGSAAAFARRVNAPSVRQADGSLVSGGNSACVPPVPILPGENWPLLSMRGSPFDAAIRHVESGGSVQSAPQAAAGAGAPVAPGGSAVRGVSAEVSLGEDAVGAWGGMDLGLEGDEEEQEEEGGGEGGAGVSGGEAGWGEDLDLDLPDLPTLPGQEGAAANGAEGAAVSGLEVPAPGKGMAAEWTETSNVAGEHAAAGSLESAMRLLHRQIGVVEFGPLREQLLAVYRAACGSLPSLPAMPPLATPICRSEARRPAVLCTLDRLVDRLKEVYQNFQGGKFAAAQSSLDQLMVMIPLTVVRTRAEEKEVRELLGIVREYKTAVLLEQHRKTLPGDAPPPRALELAAYLTHCKLQPAHLLLTLNLAMSLAFKMKNFITAAGFARRILETPEAGSVGYAQLATKARKVLAASEQQARNTHTLDYDERNPFELCCGSFTPIYRGSPSVHSPFCGAAYKPEYKGEVCRVDGMARIGEETLGLVVFSAPPSGRRGAKKPAVPEQQPVAAGGGAAAEDEWW